MECQLVWWQTGSSLTDNLKAQRESGSKSSILSSGVSHACRQFALQFIFDCWRLERDDYSSVWLASFRSAWILFYFLPFFFPPPTPSLVRGKAQQLGHTFRLDGYSNLHVLIFHRYIYTVYKYIYVSFIFPALLPRSSRPRLTHSFSFASVMTSCQKVGSS